MILENIALHFDRQEGDRLVFKTSSGKEISFDSGLLDSSTLGKDVIYLSIDSSEIRPSSPQDILNEILDN